MEEAYLNQALQLARQRRGFCAPNPAVGAVIVKNRQVIATGLHWAVGFPHAEQAAVSKIKNQAEDASLYVTLEPCCHWGRTAPCTQAIIKAGIREVFFGMIDPNPLVSGKAISQLQAKGIDCKHIQLPELSRFYRSYRYWTKTKLPWVTAKLAITLDGKIAGSQGQPVQITGMSLKRYTHQCRKQSDAILTTVTTLNRDNPQLNVRLEEKVYRKPLYILDSQLRLRDNLNIYQSTEKLIIFHSNNVDRSKIKHLSAQGIVCRACDTQAQGLDLGHVLAYIGRDGIHDLWVEAGGRCFESLFEDKLINSALIYTALKTLGPNATPGFSKSFELLQGAKNTTWKSMGEDMLCQIDYSN